jgi:hypothetical protein
MNFGTLLLSAIQFIPFFLLHIQILHIIVDLDAKSSLSSEEWHHNSAMKRRNPHPYTQRLKDNGSGRIAKEHYQLIA